MLEDAVAIAEPAVGRRYALHLAALPVECLHIGTEPGQLDPVGAYVLHRGRTDGTRDQRQILQPVPTLLQGMAHQLVPLLPRRHVQQPVAAVILQFDAFHSVEHDQTSKIIAEQDVAPTTQHQAWQGTQLWIGPQLAEIIQLGDFGKPEAVCVQAQGIEGRQGGMGSEFHLRVPTRARAQFTPDPRDEKPGYCSDSNRWSRVAPSVR
ncbi:hypothetical protein D3C84_521640 [compost metagenome]